MINKIQMYTINCDVCEADVLDGDDHGAWDDVQYVEDIASENGWHKDGKKHYCRNCHSFNDDDELVIKNPTL